MYECAVKLIKKGKAFVCDLSADQIKVITAVTSTPGKTARTVTVRSRRTSSYSKNMKNGMYKDGEKVLRAKIDMASPNINMRDPVLLSCCPYDTPQHGRQVVHLPDVRLRSSDRGRSRAHHTLHLYSGI